ncbi:hypothetical protein AT864_00583 [Anoxybacillus sp. P3H1B]|uniref:uroporphyrinogen-III synthase n=1 Tax=Anoxybacillus sp. P3H1B TaxID=1769293 RepID=UPI00079BB217|nr:uroporphyrinogen-III synthase [Anoxybacillus sp. P3H1B]KXG11500.1 hypothetical protein AT864_00583 [Anoxybacillus sp. P3H1B]
MKTLPLQGKSILVTRGKEQANEFSAKLRKAGACPIEIPLISISAVTEREHVEKCLSRLSSYRWLVFTSANGVRFFFSFITDKTTLPHVAVVGTKTAHALEKRGIHPDIIPDRFVAEGLAEAMKAAIEPGDRILLVRGNLARPNLKEELAELGAEVTDLVVYETHLNESGKEELFHLLSKRAIDIMTFTSSSTVQSFMQMVEGENWQELIESCVIACIGPITKHTAEQFGLTVHICPDQYTIDDMIEAMEKFFINR